MEKNAKIYVAGHRGLVGGSIVRCLQEKGYTNIITRTHKELDLLNSWRHLSWHRGTGDFVNVGTGKECTIKELAETVEDVVYADVREDGRKCKMVWDSSKPNGTPRKLCDVTRLNALGWKAKVDVREGIEIAYNDFLHGEVRK